MNKPKIGKLKLTRYYLEKKKICFPEQFKLDRYSVDAESLIGLVPYDILESYQIGHKTVYEKHQRLGKKVIGAFLETLYDDLLETNNVFQLPLPGKNHIMRIEQIKRYFKPVYYNKAKGYYDPNKIIYSLKMII